MPLTKDPGKGAPECALAGAVSFQLMEMVTGVEWLSEPDVPVTVKVTCDAGVWPFELLPHPRANIETRSSTPSTLVHRMLLRVSGFRLRVARTVPNSPRPGNKAAMPDKL